MPMRYRRFSARFVQRSAIGNRSRYVDPLWGVTLVTIAPRAWRPPVDVCETAAGLSVIVELAGIDEDGAQVSLYADALVVEGERVLETCGPDGRYHRAEIRQG